MRRYYLALNEAVGTMAGLNYLHVNGISFGPWHHISRMIYKSLDVVRDEAVRTAISEGEARVLEILDDGRVALVEKYLLGPDGSMVMGTFYPVRR